MLSNIFTIRNWVLKFTVTALIYFLSSPAIIDTAVTELTGFSDPDTSNLLSLLPESARTLTYAPVLDPHHTGRLLDPHGDCSIPGATISVNSETEAQNASGLVRACLEHDLLYIGINQAWDQLSQSPDPAAASSARKMRLAADLHFVSNLHRECQAEDSALVRAWCHGQTVIFGLGVGLNSLRQNYSAAMTETSVALIASWISLVLIGGLLCCSERLFRQAAHALAGGTDRRSWRLRAVGSVPAIR